MGGSEAQVLSSCGLAQSSGFPVLANTSRLVLHALQRQKVLTGVSIYSLPFFYWEGASQLLAEKIKQEHRGDGNLPIGAARPGRRQLVQSWGPGWRPPGAAVVLAEDPEPERGRSRKSKSFCALRMDPTPPPPRPRPHHPRIFP